MKSALIALSIIITLVSTSFAQDNELQKEQAQTVQHLINIFKTKNKAKIAACIDYPLKREYPLKDIKNKKDFVQRFDEIFDKEFLNHIAKSSTGNWSQVGWRGIMLDNGSIWIDDEGKIIAVNHQSPKEKLLLAKAIQADKNTLPKSLQRFEKPTYLIFTQHYKIRIDEKKDGTYRYAAWKINTKKKETDIVIENGNMEFQGSGGNHTFEFKNNGYTYLVSINIITAEGDPEASLQVLKGEETILTEAGKIKRN